MAILVKEKDILFAVVNILLFISTFVYIILWNLSVLAYNMSGELAPLESSGIYVFITFAEIGFVIAVWVTALVDLWWIYRIIQKKARQYRRDNL